MAKAFADVKFITYITLSGHIFIIIVFIRENQGCTMQSQRLSLLLWLKALTLTAFLVLSLFTGFYPSSLAARSAFVYPLGLRQNPETFIVGPSSGHNIFVHDDVRRSGLESRTSPGLIASQLPPSTKISPGVLTTQQMRPPSFLPQSSASNFVSAATDGNGFGFNIVHPKPYQQQSLTPSYNIVGP